MKEQNFRILFSSTDSIEISSKHLIFVYEKIKSVFASENQIVDFP